MATQGKKSFTLVELAAALAIGLILTTVMVRYVSSVFRQQQVLDQARMVKSAFMLSKANAIERSAPVLFSVASTDGAAILSRLSPNRDGQYTEVIIGESLMAGAVSNAEVKLGLPGDVSSPLTHESTGEDLNEFNNNSFYIQSNGLVLDSNTLQSTDGVFYFYRVPTDIVTGVYISPVGEIKIAVTTIDATGNWTPWAYIN